MATLPAVERLRLIEEFGPHRAYSAGVAPRNRGRAGQAGQDALLLLRHAVRHSAQGQGQPGHRLRAVGGVPLQPAACSAPRASNATCKGSHPDRLLTAYQRDPAAPRRFPRAAYDEAIQRVAAEIQRIQTDLRPRRLRRPQRRQPDDGKGVPDGQVRPDVPEDLQHRLQRPAVHGQRRGGEQEGVRRRPGRQPLGRHSKAEVDLDQRRQHRRVLPDPHAITSGRPARTAAASSSSIRASPRMARTCDLFLPVKPGRDIALFNGILHLMIENDWLDHDFIARAHRSASTRSPSTSRNGRRGAPPRSPASPSASIRQAAEWWGTAKSSFLMHARGIEHHTHGVQNCLGAINIVLASGRIGREGCGYATITGQGNGQGGREHGQKCDQLPGGRDIENAEHRAHVANVWGIRPDELPRGGVDAYEIFRKVDRGEVRGLLSICFNPMVSLPDSGFIAWMLERLQFFVCIDFFLSETAQHADIVLPGSLHEEDEGTVTSAEGRVIKINKAVDCPGDARQDWRIIQDIAQRLGRERGFTFSQPREIFEELRVRRPAASRIMPASPTKRSRSSSASSGPVPSEDHPGTPRLFEAGSWNPIAKGQGPLLLPRRQGPLHRRPVHAARGRRGRRIPAHPDHGPRGQPVPFRHADAPHRAAGGSVSGAADRDASAAGREARHQGRRLGAHRVAPRRLHAACPGGDHDSARHRSSFPTTGPAARASTR